MLTRKFFGSLVGVISVIGLSAILAVATLAWIGYDYGQFSDDVMPASRFDAVTNSWAIYQAMDNLVHRPRDLGYSPMFYDEPSPFAYTIAPYGIAVVTLPVYYLTGQDLAITFNLYYLATFVLTAWAMYLLIRYLLDVSQAVAIVMALSVVFSQYRLGHIWHIETLSLHFYILAVYCLHRLIDTPRWYWSVGLAVAFWFTMTTSGYLGMAFIVTAVVIGLYVLIKRLDLLTRQCWLALALAAGIAVVILAPFLAFRFENEAFSGGYSLDAAMHYSAEPRDWLAGTSFIYSGLNPSPVGGERDLFLGFVPLILGYLGWRYRRDEQESRAGRALSPREIVILYTLIIVTGYVLTLGPVLKFNEERITPLPYMLLFQVPGISSMRVPARFIFMSIVGISLLGSYALTRLQTRLPRAVYAVVGVILVVILAVELIPARQSKSYRLLDPGVALRLEPETLYDATRDQEKIINDWLADLPRGTVLFHYPTGSTDLMVMEAMRIYVYDQPTYDLPIINGWGSYRPEWFEELSRFPEPAILYLLRERGARYAVVHNDFMSPTLRSSVKQQIETLALQGIDLPLVATVGSADVYDLGALKMESITYGFDTILGSGWGLPERSGDSTFRWMTAREATLAFPLVGELPLQVSFYTSDFAAPDIADSLTLTVNDVAVPLERDDRLWRGVIPRAAQPDDAMLRLVFRIDRTLSPLERGTGTDTRQLGVRFEGLAIEPLPPLLVWEFDQPSPGTGWSGPETEGEGITFQWTNAPEATLILPVAPGMPLQLEFRVMGGITPEILDSLSLEAGGEPVALTVSGDIYSGVIPAEAVADEGQLTLMLRTSDTASPVDLGRGTDTRQLGVRLDWLRIQQQTAEE